MPGLSRTTQCRGCGKEIAFIKTANGKSVPVDPEAVYFIADSRGTGTYIQIDGSVKRGREPGAIEKGSSIGYITHFATCTAADRFRKKNKSERVRDK